MGKATNQSPLLEPTKVGVLCTKYDLLCEEFPELNNILAYVQVSEEPLTVKVDHLEASCLYCKCLPIRQ